MATDFDLLLAHAAVLALGGWALWALLALAVALADRDLGRRIAPPVIRGLLAAGLCAATVSPARADSPLDGLPLPDRPPTSAPAATTAHPVSTAQAEEPAPPAVHVVRSGECLWTIARRHLPGADDATVAAAVAAWHRVNRDVIGADPDLLRPCQRLVRPAGDSA